MSSLHLYQRPTEGELYVMNLSPMARNWRRAIIDVGGFLDGSFEIHEFGGLSWFALQNFYNSMLGCRLVERTYGLTTWEGLVYEMRLVRRGQEYRRTLSSDWFHNKVKTLYSYPSSSDTEQGSLAYVNPSATVDTNQAAMSYLIGSVDTQQGALTYNPIANSFQDAGQDFEDWETTSGKSDYRIVITNNDATVTWGYIGKAFTTTNTDDTVFIFQDEDRITAGWNGTAPGAKVPNTYVVSSTKGNFQDAGQDFDDYEPTNRATHQITITNSDASTSWGYLGADFTTTNPNDSARIYQTAILSGQNSRRGWNGSDPVIKTPSSYIVQAVAWAFQDDAQDFSEWETLAGDAVYTITVVNSDGSTTWGFAGASFTTTNANDSIYIYTDIELATSGWNGDDGGTPSTYEVRNVVLSGARQDTGWSENTDSSGVYGTMEYVLGLGGAVPEGAVAMRDRQLTEFAWPRSRKMGGGRAMPPARNTGAVLEVSVAGFWATLKWLYRDTSRVAAASDMIETLVSASEFVTARRIEDNALGVKADCDPIPQRLGDMVEDKILEGDIDGNQWMGGVYEGREFVYEQSPTTVEYHSRPDGVLVGLNGHQVSFPMFRPGVLLKDLAAPIGGQPAGGAVRDDPRVGYIEEVEWIMDKNELRYKLSGQENSVTVLREQLQSGSFGG